MEIQWWCEIPLALHNTTMSLTNLKAIGCTLELIRGNIIGYTLNAFKPLSSGYNLKTAKGIHNELRADNYDNMGYSEVFVEYIEHAFRKKDGNIFIKTVQDGDGYHHFEITLS